MLLPRAWNHAVLFAGTVSSPGYVAFSLGAWVIVGTAACVSSFPGRCHLSQRQPFTACVGSMLVAWSSGACATTIQISFLVLFLEHAVLDDKATLLHKFLFAL